MAREGSGALVWLGAAVCYPLTRLLARRRFEGEEHIPRSGPVLVVCNHISYLDPIYTAVFVHRRGRMPHFLAKASLWRVPMMRQMLTGTGQIPVYRDDPEAGSSLREALRALDEGKVVLIYPEGTITRDPRYWPMVARTGVARLALRSGAPVLPVVHWGTHRVYDHYRRRFRPLPRIDVVVRAGTRLDLSGYQNSPVDRVLLREITGQIMLGIRDLLAEVRQEQPPAEFFALPAPTRDQDDEGNCDERT